MNIPILDLHPGTGEGSAKSDFQRGLDPRVAKEAGYEGAVIKFGQGDGTYNPYRLRQYFQRFAEVFENMGGYWFLDATASGVAQARDFVDQMKLATGRTDGRGIAIVTDFEEYAGEGWDLSPTNDHLRDFVRELRRFVGRHPIGGYSNRHYWMETGIPTGPISDYDIDYVYDSRYPYSTILQNPIRTMRASLNWYRNDREARQRWGGLKPGEDPAIWQASGASWVGDVVCDTNLMFVPFKTLTTRTN